MQTSTGWLAARVLVALLALAHGAYAQEVLGIVRDSATRAPVPGAVVMLLDAADAVLVRNLTNQRGEYRLPSIQRATRLRVVRLGFRPRFLSLPTPANGIAHLDVDITAIPVTLESMRTLAASSCPQRSDASASLALLDQARSGLLTTIVSRGVKPARMKRLLFDRQIDGTSDRVTHQRVRIDSAVTTGSFGAVRSASDFVKQGFMLDSAGVRTFFAPDAETLVDDAFASGYCFRIVDAERSRAHQIGLGFRAANSHRDRVDIDGALWIDTLARALVGVEFHYVGLDRAYESYHPGGRVSFQAMSNGVVLVDRWSLRLVDPREDPAAALLRRLQPQRGAVARCPTNVCSHSSTPARYDVQEVGGELARAAWDDGTSWKGTFGRLVVHANRDASPFGMRTVMKLDDTAYQAVSDPNGDLAFEDLVSGPYELVVVDPDLSPLDIALSTGMSFMANRDSTLSFRVHVPNAVDYAEQVCSADGGALGSAWILGRVTTPDGHPVSAAKWAVQRNVDDAGGAGSAQSGLTGDDGTFHYCRLALGTVVRVSAEFPGAAETSRVMALTKRLTIVALELQPR